jgi:hypothetical protein
VTPIAKPDTFSLDTVTPGATEFFMEDEAL